MAKQARMANNHPRDDDILLESSRGETGFVVMVQVGLLDLNDRKFHEGYVELHKYNRETAARERIGERQVFFLFPLFNSMAYIFQWLYPPPLNHASQYIEFSWNDILRNKFEFCITQERPPPLYIGDLRGFHKGAVNQHLFSERDVVIN